MAYFDLPENRPTVVEVVDRMEAGKTLRLAVDVPGLSQRELHREVTKVGVDNYRGPGLAVQ